MRGGSRSNTAGPGNEPAVQERAARAIPRGSRTSSGPERSVRVPQVGGSYHAGGLRSQRLPRRAPSRLIDRYSRGVSLRSPCWRPIVRSGGMAAPCLAGREMPGPSQRDHRGRSIRSSSPLAQGLSLAGGIGPPWAELREWHGTGTTSRGPPASVPPMSTSRPHSRSPRGATRPLGTAGVEGEPRRPDAGDGEVARHRSRH